MTYVSHFKVSGKQYENRNGTIYVKTKGYNGRYIKYKPKRRRKVLSHITRSYNIYKVYNDYGGNPRYSNPNYVYEKRTRAKRKTVKRKKRSIWNIKL